MSDTQGRRDILADVLCGDDPDPSALLAPAEAAWLAGLADLAGRPGAPPARDRLVLLPPSAGRRAGLPGRPGPADPESIDPAGSRAGPDGPGLPEGRTAASPADPAGHGPPARPEPPARPGPAPHSPVKRRTTLSLTPFVADCLDLAKTDVRSLVPAGCRVTKSALADAALAMALRELGAKGRRSRLVRELVREAARARRDP